MYVYVYTHARMHSDWLLNSEAKERENIQTLNSLLLWAARVESASDTLVPVTAAWGKALPGSWSQLRSLEDTHSLHSAQWDCSRFNTFNCFL